MLGDGYQSLFELLHLPCLLPSPQKSSICPCLAGDNEEEGAFLLPLAAEQRRILCSACNKHIFFLLWRETCLVNIVHAHGRTSSSIILPPDPPPPPLTSLAFSPNEKCIPGFSSHWFIPIAFLAGLTAVQDCCISAFATPTFPPVPWLGREDDRQWGWHVSLWELEVA